YRPGASADPSSTAGMYDSWTSGRNSRMRKSTNAVAKAIVSSRAAMAAFVVAPVPPAVVRRVAEGESPMPLEVVGTSRAALLPIQRAIRPGLSAAVAAPAAAAEQAARRAAAT